MASQCVARGCRRSKWLLSVLCSSPPCFFQCVAKGCRRSKMASQRVVFLPSMFLSVLLRGVEDPSGFSVCSVPALHVSFSVAKGCGRSKWLLSVLCSSPPCFFQCVAKECRRSKNGFSVCCVPALHVSLSV